MTDFWTPTKWRVRIIDEGWRTLDEFVDYDDAVHAMRAYFPGRTLWNGYEDKRFGGQWSFAEDGGWGANIRADIWPIRDEEAEPPFPLTAQ